MLLPWKFLGAPHGTHLDNFFSVRLVSTGRRGSKDGELFLNIVVVGEMKSKDKESYLNRGRG